MEAPGEDESGMVEDTGEDEGEVIGESETASVAGV